MLKIKNDKWEEFCEKAESLGFDKLLCGGLYKIEDCFIYPKGSYKNGDAVCCTKDCLLINVSINTNLGLSSMHEIILTFSNMVGQPITEVSRRKQYDILFDLIQMGYVEKV